MGVRGVGRVVGALLLGVAVWFVTLVVVLAAANGYDEDLGYRLNVLGRSSPLWPRWEPWWGWYLMHGGVAAVGVAAAGWQWAAGRSGGRPHPVAAASALRWI